MVLTMQEKVFYVEHYFHLYGVGYLSQQSLLHVLNEFCEQFQKPSPNNMVILVVIKKFCCMESI